MAWDVHQMYSFLNFAILNSIEFFFDQEAWCKQDDSQTKDDKSC